MNNITVNEIMSSQLITLHPKEKLQRAKEVFNQYDIHHILIDVMGELKGIISQGDLLFLEGVVTTGFDRFLQQKRFDSATVDEIMTPSPITCKHDQSIAEVLDLMLEYRINALPVIKDDKLCGIVTTRDLMKHMRSALG